MTCTQAIHILFAIGPGWWIVLAVAGPFAGALLVAMFYELRYGPEIATVQTLKRGLHET